eukprot:7014580-Prymnesium_polylepis.1
MHSLAQETSPAAVHTSARQNSLRSHPPIYKRSRAPLLSPFHRRRSASVRDFRKVKPRTARRQRIESKYNCLADIGGS